MEYFTSLENFLLLHIFKSMLKLIFVYLGRGVYFSVWTEGGKNMVKYHVGGGGNMIERGWEKGGGGNAYLSPN